MSGSGPLVTMVTGNDESLLRDVAQRVVDAALGSEDRTLAVDEFAGEEYPVAAVVDAAQTPPLFSAHRVVVARDLAARAAADLEPLVRYLADPLDTTALVLVWGSGRVPKALADALKAAGATTTSASVPGGRGRQMWLDDAMAAADVKLDTAARRLVADHLGDDLARLRGLLDSLTATYGAGARVGVDQVAPFLGEAGAVPPWELTDAIDRGDVAVAVERLQRMLEAGGRHPLQVMVTLQSHVERMVRLHGAGVSNEKDAAARLGMKGSTFPARKALQKQRELGGRRLQRALELVADADLDLRGASAWPAEQVMEVLVARLAQLSR
ncbi:MAG: DNA polymerase III subunit delta [Acidimicrobiia bacterium]|nr:DNA polymerase III subunit delta [Acidimicrobiia bacterium]